VTSFPLDACNDVLTPLAVAIVSKNSQPTRIVDTVDRPLEPPYSINLGKAINHYETNGSLNLKLINESGSISRTILQQAISQYSLVPYSNLSDIKFSNALENRFFYQNNLHTFFVEPSLTFEPPWAHETSYGMAGISWEDLDLDKVPVEPELEAAVPVVAEGLTPERPPRPVFAGAKFAFQTAKNWATDPALFVAYDGGLISRGGRYEPTEGVASTELRSVEGRVVVGGNGLRPSAIEVLNAEPDTIRKLH
jgi:hypothetical protein